MTVYHASGQVVGHPSIFKSYFSTRPGRRRPIAYALKTVTKLQFEVDAVGLGAVRIDVADLVIASGQQVASPT